MRFKAPADISGIDLSSGPVPVMDGFVTIPDDANQGDLAGLAVNGFVRDEAAAPAPVASHDPAPQPAPIVETDPVL